MGFLDSALDTCWLPLILPPLRLLTRAPSRSLTLLPGLFAGCPRRLPRRRDALVGTARTSRPAEGQVSGGGDKGYEEGYAEGYCPRRVPYEVTPTARRGFME